MNPEFQRNFWLEMSPSRAAIMPIVMALIFVVSSLNDGLKGVGGAAAMIFFVVAIVWGAFKAARTVTDEVRDRTWDGQRMSSLSPAAMTLGKLFGSTIYCWYGGAVALIALVVARNFAPDPSPHGPLALEVARLVLSALLAQAVALAASLAGARRRRGQARVDSFLYFMAGLVSFWAAESATTFKSALSGIVDPNAAGATSWWGATFDAHLFDAASVAIFAVLAILVAWRLMRVELQAPAQPAAYLVLTSAAVLWYAGLSTSPEARIAQATMGFVAIAWLTAWIEPKDVLAWRALARGGGSGRGALLPAAASGFVLACAAAIAAAIFALTNGSTGLVSSPLAGFALVAFLARDLAIFAFFHLGASTKRADFAAVLTIALLYTLAPALLGGFTSSDIVKAAFIPGGADEREALTSHAISVVSGLIQCTVFAALARARFQERFGARADAPPQPAPV